MFISAEDAALQRFRETPSARRIGAERRRREQELRQAINRRELVLHYQPLVSLSSGAICGAEALVRWPHKRRGLVPAADFAPMAEQAGLTAEIGGWAMLEACSAAAAWPVQIPVSVAVAARQLDDDALLDQVAGALAASGLAPERLELELGEESLIGCQTETLLSLAALRDLGVGLALDDFGVGAGSLSLLKRLPLTTLKLGGAMLRDLPRNREDAAIARAVVEAGHALDFIVVAEGVETDAQRAFLVSIGCDAGQGALFGAPSPHPVQPMRPKSRGRLAAALQDRQD
jgi:EAL domain-containing protein (putative c-di-GMP-specific phosphodiesterase class I)